MSAKRAVAARPAARPRRDPSTAVRQPRNDTVWMVAATAVSTVLFLTTFAGRADWGDSAEAISGVRSVGITHAPGYLTYVLGARVFSWLIPFGSLALRVNLFSVVCAVAAIAVVYRLARRVGASPPGAAVGSVALASAASFWFYATYAKAYALTSLMVAVIVLLAFQWKEEGGRWRLAVAAVIAGLSLGASYQVVAVLLPVLGLFLLWRGRRPGFGDIATIVACGLVAAALVAGLTMTRARSDPAVNWGSATSAERFVDLVRMKDFGFGNRTFAGFGSQSGSDGQQSDSGIAGGSLRRRTSNPPKALLLLPLRVLRQPIVEAVEFGPLLMLLGLAGLVFSFRRSSNVSRPVASVLLAAAVLNVVAVSISVYGSGRIYWFVTTSNVVSLGGFFLAAHLAFAVWIALGATWLLDAVGPATREVWTRAESRRRARGTRYATQRPSSRFGFAVAGLAAALLAGVGLHWFPASHRGPDFAGDYAANVFDSLPKNSLLLSWGAERAFTLEYQQVVNGRRPDVDVIRLEQILQPWYRRQVARRVGIAMPRPEKYDFFAEGARIARAEIDDRPVFLDYAALYYASRADPDLGFRQAGIVARVTKAKGRQSFDIDALAAKVDAYRSEGLYTSRARRRWPNNVMLQPYVAANVDLGSAFAQVEDYAAAAEHYKHALALRPNDDALRRSYEIARDTAAGGG